MEEEGTGSSPADTRRRSGQRENHGQSSAWWRKPSNAMMGSSKKRTQTPSNAVGEQGALRMICGWDNYIDLKGGAGAHLRTHAPKKPHDSSGQSKEMPKDHL